MNKLLLILLISLIVGSVSAQDSTVWIKADIPTEFSITGISFLSPESVLVVTSGGSYLHTVDAGKNWMSYNLLEKVPLEDIQYLDSKTAVMCGRNGRIFVTQNGLNNWQNKSIADTMPWFTDILMTDQSNGMVIGLTRNRNVPYQSIAFRTTDGGQTWNELLPMGLGYAQLAYPDDSLLYLLSMGRLNYSADKGRSWLSNPTVEGEPCRTVSFYGNRGILAGLGGMCAFSADKGKTWRKSPQNTALVFVCSAMINERVGYLAGMDGLLMRTDNGGLNWEREILPETFHIYDMAVVGNRLYVAGSNASMYYRTIK